MKNTKTNCVEWIYYAYLSKDSRKLHKRPFCTIIQPMNDSNYGIYARPDKVRGIIAIRNLKSGRALLEKTEDAVKAFKDERFRLDLGLHGSKELQAEYTAIGLELFSIDLIRECGKDEDIDAALSECEEEYRKEGISLYDRG